MLSYDEINGLLAGLDALHNMPERVELINAANTAAVRSGVFRSWDNKISCFKTIFRYLPGSLTALKSYTRAVSGASGRDSISGGVVGKVYSFDVDALEQEQFASFASTSKTTATQPPMHNLIVDDASVNLNLLSRELCPQYIDELSSTAGLELGKKSCLLVAVTAVDVLTTTRSIRKDNKNDNNAHQSDGLDGLVGIYVGHKDPLCSWWGILPLKTEHGNGNNSPMAALSEPQPFGKATNRSKKTPKGKAVDPTGFPETISPTGRVATFVNCGTHQIPLFEGSPPDILFELDDPFDWLIKKLENQQRRVKRVVRAGNVLNWCGNSSSSQIYDVIDENIYYNTDDYIALSSGCSAVVRLADGQMRASFNTEPIALDVDKAINVASMDKVLKALASFPVRQPLENEMNLSSIPVLLDENRYNHLRAKFAYDRNKHVAMRYIKEAIPPNIRPEALVREINKKFVEKISS